MIPGSPRLRLKGLTWFYHVQVLVKQWWQPGYGQSKASDVRAPLSLTHLRLLTHSDQAMSQALQPTVISFSATMSVGEKASRWALALALLSCMRPQEIRPNHVSPSEPSIRPRRAAKRHARETAEQCSGISGPASSRG